MTDGEDLISWLEFHYTQESERIALVKLVRLRQNSKWWRVRQMLKGWFKNV